MREHCHSILWLMYWELRGSTIAVSQLQCWLTMVLSRCSLRFYRQCLKSLQDFRYENRRDFGGALSRGRQCWTTIIKTKAEFIASSLMLLWDGDNVLAATLFWISIRMQSYFYRWCLVWLSHSLFFACFIPSTVSNAVSALPKTMEVSKEFNAAVKATRA